MSVKFENETIKTTTVAPDGKHDLIHDVGNALTRGGGANGYLAVRMLQLNSRPNAMLTYTCKAGLSQTTPGKPATHQDAYLWYARRSTRVPSLVDRARPKQAWTLLYLQGSQDGHLRRIHQRAIRARPDLSPAENVPRADKLEGQDTPDPCQQLDCM